MVFAEHLERLISWRASIVGKHIDSILSADQLLFPRSRDAAYGIHGSRLQTCRHAPGAQGGVSRQSARCHRRSAAVFLFNVASSDAPPCRIGPPFSGLFNQAIHCSISARLLNRLARFCPQFSQLLLSSSSACAVILVVSVIQDQEHANDRVCYGVFAQSLIPFFLCGSETKSSSRSAPVISYNSTGRSQTNHSRRRSSAPGSARISRQIRSSSHMNAG
jgi:hypothetical protein